MLHSWLSLAVAALAVLSPAHAQIDCGGRISEAANGTLGRFKVTYLPAFTLLTVAGVNNNQNTESYVLYCDGQVSPETTALQTYNIPTSVGRFKVPVKSVAVSGTYTSSYIELAGGRDAIKVMLGSNRVVSPCLQAAVQNGSIVELNEGDLNQYDTLDAGFRELMFAAQVKNIWIPSTVDIDPLARIEYITAISLFFNNGVRGEEVYTKIKTSYLQLRDDMTQIPEANRKRIAWVRYDFTASAWRLRNSQFTTAIIKAAGGVPFPLSGEVTDDAQVSAEDIKILLRNAQIIIDQTDFTGQKAVSTVELWRTLAGFNSSDQIPALASKQTYTLDFSINADGISDYNYRLASRPDILLKDLISVQYPTYLAGYTPMFMNGNFAYGTRSNAPITAKDCGTTQYNSGDIPTIFHNSFFTGDGLTPPALVGGGIYGTGEQSGGGSNGGGGSKTGIIVAVVCVAVVLVAGFAFIFFKWTKRAKEDRFIELEEEMNNEIPLR